MERTSLISQLSKEKLEKLLEESTSLSNLISKLEITSSQFQIDKLREKIKEEGFSLAKVEANFLIKRAKELSNRKVPLSEKLKENIKFIPRSRKNELFSSGLLKNECYECKIGNTYNNKPITLQFDHINGDNKDNRIENLRVLCPNCHSQTKTYSGRNKPLNKICTICNKNNIEKNSQKFCTECHDNYVITGIVSKFGSLYEFQEILKTTSYDDISEKYNIRYNVLKTTVKYFKDSNFINLDNRKKHIEKIKTKKCQCCFNFIRDSAKFCSNECFNKMRELNYIDKVKWVILLRNHDIKVSVIGELLNINRGTVTIYTKRYAIEKTPFEIKLRYAPINIISVLLKKYQSLTKVGQIFNCTAANVKKKIKKENIAVYLSFVESKPKAISSECVNCSRLIKSNGKKLQKYCSRKCREDETKQKHLKIINLYKQELSYKDIAKQVFVSRKTVNDVCLKYKRSQ